MRIVGDPERARDERRAEAALAAERAYAALASRPDGPAGNGRFHISHDATRRLVRVADRQYGTDFVFGADGTARALRPGTDEDAAIPPTATEIEILIDEIRGSEPPRNEK